MFKPWLSYTGYNKQGRYKMDFSQALRIVKDVIHESELKDYDKKSIIFDLIWLENELTTNNKGEK